MSMYQKYLLQNSLRFKLRLSCDHEQFLLSILNDDSNCEAKNFTLEEEWFLTGASVILTDAMETKI